MGRPQRLSLTAAAALLAACNSTTRAVGQQVDTEQAVIVVETFSEGLEHPWGLVFLPDGSMLVTERPGRLRHISASGVLSEPISGLPEIDARDQGGLLDVEVDPDFITNRVVYLTFSEPGPDGTNSTAVLRAALSTDNAALGGGQVIFSQQPKVDSTKHFGSRLVFDGEGHLFVGLGERSDEEFRGQAQELDSHLGKIVRIFPDGGVPDDNPFVGEPGALPEIWSYGHRNIQAAFLHPQTGQLWEIEHGPRGGDELNIVEPGANYGWPLVSYGINYWGTPVGSGEATMEGVVEPVYQWTPVIAPSGMVIYTGDAFPEWRGDLFVGGLASTALVRLELEGERVVAEERIIDDFGLRIRGVVQGPDGALYLLTDESDGAVLRVGPAQ